MCGFGARAVLLAGCGTLMGGDDGSSSMAYAMAYVALFPLDIWLYEAVLGTYLVWMYGHNVAYCYRDYADAFCNACCRLGHGVFWLGLGVICFVFDESLDTVAEAAAAGLTVSVTR